MADNASKIHGVYVLRFTASTAGLGAGGSTSLDVDGNEMRIPSGFVIDDGYIQVGASAVAGITVSVGVNGSNNLVANLDNSPSTVAARVDVNASLTGVGRANTTAEGNLLQVHNNNQAETGSPQVKILLMGHYEFDAS